MRDASVGQRGEVIRSWGQACEGMSNECSRRGAAQNQRRGPREAAGRTRKRASEGRDKNRFPRSAGQLTVGPGARR